MQLLSTLALLLVAVQSVLASPERKLLRSASDSPLDFSALTGSTTSQGKSASLPSIDSITGDQSAIANLLPTSGTGVTSGGLPSADSLSSLTQGGGLSDLSSITGGSGIPSLPSVDSITGGSGIASLPSLDSITDSGTTGGTGTSTDISSITDALGGSKGGLSY